MKRLTFNDHFKVAEKQTAHVNILMRSDLTLFIDPYNIANNLDDKTAHLLYVRMKNFLETLNRNYIVPNDKKNGIPFLSHLQEANEYGFGYSDTNKGKGIGPTKAEVIFQALANNKFARAGVSITNEAHNVLLLVKGIGQDNMSDTICNVCRDIFADFTLRQCQKYNIAVGPTRIEFYDQLSSSWKTKLVDLPSYLGRPIILVPKSLGMGKRAYSSNYNWFISSNHIAPEILDGTIKADDSNNFVNTLKDGTKKAIIKNINKHYRKPKEKLVEFVMKYNGSLENFQQHVKNNFPELTDEDFANLVND